MRYRVRLSRRARRQVALARAWWRLYSPARPDAIDDELRKVRRLLAESPEMGAEPTDLELAGVRRVLLGRVDHWLYYAVDHASKEIEVLMVWHTSRVASALDEE